MVFRTIVRRKSGFDFLCASASLRDAIGLKRVLVLKFLPSEKLGLTIKTENLEKGAIK